MTQQEVKWLEYDGLDSSLPCALKRQHVLAVASRELAPPRPALSCGMGGRLRYRQRRSSPLRSCDATVTPAWSSRPRGFLRKEASS